MSSSRQSGEEQSEQVRRVILVQEGGAVVAPSEELWPTTVLRRGEEYSRGGYWSLEEGKAGLVLSRQGSLSQLPAWKDRGAYLYSEILYILLDR